MPTIRQEKRSLSAAKQALAKEARAAKSRTYSTGKAQLPIRTKPIVTVEAPKKPEVKVFKVRTLAAIATKLYEYDHEGYELLKDRRSNPKDLAQSLLDGPFKAVIAKYRGYNQQELLETTILYIRHKGERSQYVVQPKKKPKARDPKRPLTESQLKAAQQAPPTPVAPATAAFTQPKGARKAVPRRNLQRDHETVRHALAALLQHNPVLQESFYEAAQTGQLKEFVRYDSAITRLAVELRQGELDAPSRLLTHLDKAAKTLFSEYRDEQLLAEERERMNAEERRKAQIAAAREASINKVKQLQKDAKRHKPLTDSELRQLQRQ